MGIKKIDDKSSCEISCEETLLKEYPILFVLLTFLAIFVTAFLFIIVFKAFGVIN